MNPYDLLRDGLGRSAENLPRVLDGLSADQLSWQPAPGTNSIGWLVWHLVRVEDSHLADLARRLDLGDVREVLLDGWNRRLGLPYADEEHGYGMSAQDVARFRVDGPQVLLDYAAAVRERTQEILATMELQGEEVLDTVVDTSWTPHVTAGVRLVSVMDDLAQHVGQAAYLRGLLPASGTPAR